MDGVWFLSNSNRVLVQMFRFFRPPSQMTHHHLSTRWWLDSMFRVMNYLKPFQELNCKSAVKMKRQVFSFEKPLCWNADFQCQFLDSRTLGPYRDGFVVCLLSLLCRSPSTLACQTDWSHANIMPPSLTLIFQNILQPFSSSCYFFFHQEWVSCQILKHDHALPPPVTPIPQLLLHF